MQPLVLFERSLSPGPGRALLCSGRAHCTVKAAEITLKDNANSEPRKPSSGFLQESSSSFSPICFVDSDEPNLTSVLEHLEDTKNNHSVKREAKLFSLFLMNIIFRN
eukprot:XP_006720875.1 putative ubiquitin-conjugating enzyme E2Q2-like protein isoform X1 [Homo sapiens]